MTNVDEKHRPNGVFIKTVSPHIVEILGGTGLDFAVLDAEHAPFDHRDLDMMMIAGRAAQLPLYVRVRDRSSASIQSALDLGACGIVVPHVDSPQIAREVVRHARFIGGSRGYSGGTRHAGYGTRPMPEAIMEGDKAEVIVQIEHPDAVRDVNVILAVEGVHGILVGKADLALAMGHTRQGPEVNAVVADMMRDLVLPAGKIVGFVVGNAAEREAYGKMGANWFLVGTDQGLLRRAARDLLSSFN
jgi:2-keto-3-deoxy-L-rhamnonate aldolase RhmA